MFGDSRHWRGGRIRAGLVAFTPAELKPGIEIILDAVEFSAVIADADMIITGEGKIDGQSLRGKCRLASRTGQKTVAYRSSPSSATLARA